MDDFNLNTIQESRAEWCEQFIMLVKPCIQEGFDAIFKEACELSKKRSMPEKYLISFQQLISQIPNWPQTMVEKETKRIMDRSHCSYLEIVLTATHIAQLKILSAIRAGQKAKVVPVDIPDLANFIHKIYINVGRIIHKNAYLYVMSTEKFPVSGLDIQKNRRKVEILIKDGILETFRKHIPIDKIIKTYLEPTIEEDVTEKIEEMDVYNTVTGAAPTAPIAENLPALSVAESTPSVAEPPPMVAEVAAAAAAPVALETISSLIEPMETQQLQPPQQSLKLSFNDIDTVQQENDQTVTVEAPKTIERLEEISQQRNMQRKIIEAEIEAEAEANPPPNLDDDFKDELKIKISDMPSDLSLPDLYDNDDI